MGGENLPPLFVMPGEGLLIGVLLFLAYKWYQNRHRSGMPVVRTLFAALICLNIWLLVIVISQPLQLWQRIVAAISVQYGSFLYYTAVRQMFKNEINRSIMRNKGFWITSLAIGIILVLDIFLFGNPKLRTYIPDYFLYVEAALGYLYLLFWDLLIIKVYLDGLKRNTHLVDLGRFGLCMLAFSLNFLGLLLVEVNLLLIQFYHKDYSIAFNSIYYLSLVVMLLLIALSYILSDKILFKILAPLYFYKNFRQRRQQELLLALHQAMIRIVPGVRLPCESVPDLRILIEISDARQVIWSLQQRLKPITPQEEATYLWQLIHKNTVLEAPGEYSPAPTYLKNIVKHNVIVAKQLQRLQELT